MNTWTHQNSIDEYRLKDWGNGLFDVNCNGKLTIHPGFDLDCKKSIEIQSLIKNLIKQNISLPVVIRFHDILRAKVIELNHAFLNSIKKKKYKSQYKTVFPIKVNQMKEVVEEIVDAGSQFEIGLEAGSKAELIAALSFNISPKSFYILNGHKDLEYTKLALMANKMGKKTIIVIEKLHEISNIKKAYQELGIKPIIGIRVKLSSKGSGQWSESTGSSAKFGLSSEELIYAIKELDSLNLKESIKLMHFHIGSQVTDLQTLIQSTKEASRYYVDLVKLYQLDLEYLDIGGGLGVSYEGYSSLGESSLNYSLQEYTDSIIENIARVCDTYGVSHPYIISESGRFLCAHHSCIITDLQFNTPIEINEKEVSDFTELSEIKKLFELNLEDQFEKIFSQISNIIDKVERSFISGRLNINQKAEINLLASQLYQKLGNLNIHNERYINFKSKLTNKLIHNVTCNFSLFQSLPDSWAINQVIPIVPLQDLSDEPTKLSRIVDLTCDSDGKIRQYLSPEGLRSYIKLHDKQEYHDYFIGFFMTGAYQDIMGDMHNLFGRLNEVHVYLDKDEPGNFLIEKIIKGNTTKNVLKTLQYNPGQMIEEVEKNLKYQVSENNLKKGDSIKILNFFKRIINKSTYLEKNN